MKRGTPSTLRGAGRRGLGRSSQIAATGGSYGGGGMSMALAALKDRTMLPNGFPVP